VVWYAVNDSFGNVQIETEIITNNLRFPGQYYDEETGLYYNFNRYYDPATGRYLRTDPIEDGLNLYVYVLNNPLRYADPQGLVVRKAWDSWSDKVTVDLEKASSFITFGSGLSEKEFQEARARTRQFIEMLDVVTQQAGWVTVAFDVGGAMATAIDISEANVPLVNMLEAHFWNAVGVAGIIGAIPGPRWAEVGAAIDAAVFFRVGNLLREHP